jgi:PilZ domain
MTDTPHLPSLDEAAAMLVDASAVDVVTERDETIELWTIASEGAELTASGPRLAVAGGMEISCRMQHGGLPIEIRAVIEQAEYRSQARASLLVRVVEVATHGYRRSSERLAVTIAASLRAVRCERIVENEVIPVTLTDLSEAGCALTLTDSRPREGDRMTLAARFLEGEVSADVRIVRLHSPALDVFVAGCRFIGVPVLSQGTLAKVLARLGGDVRPATDVGSIRESLGTAGGAKPLKPGDVRAEDGYWTFGKRPAARIHEARRAV